MHCIPTGIEIHFLYFLQGTNPVLYSSAGWLKASRETTVARHAIQALHESHDKVGMTHRTAWRHDCVQACHTGTS
jgi:hypothetical protein